MDHLQYRVRQYFRALWDAPDEAGLQRAREILSPQLFDLFNRMLPFEQAHAIRVLRGVEAGGQTDPVLLHAALLHDIGKVRYPLKPWERAFAVVVNKTLPRLAEKWGRGQPTGLRSGLVVAAQHAEWGAEMAAEAGASAKVIWLILHHQDDDVSQLPEGEGAMLPILQEADAAN